MFDVGKHEYGLLDARSQTYINIRRHARTHTSTHEHTQAQAFPLFPLEIEEPPTTPASAGERAQRATKAPT